MNLHDALTGTLQTKASGLAALLFVGLAWGSQTRFITFGVPVTRSPKTSCEDA
jgi:hypothetical protein